MKKLYVKPELEVLELSAANEFLVSSPEYGVNEGVMGDDMLDDGNNWTEVPGGNVTDPWA
ncbi:MAG: hypothetical protein E7540_00470 [Ruminococcaceae bacterium]|nr:hypothetical protein [Oscillospiraceae bacterium]